jgi:hypothetical protein
MSKALQSQAFANAYLRIDGRGIDAPAASGSGVVNCQSGVGELEVLDEQVQSDGTVALASHVFPDVYLRMDGGGVTSPSGTGGGTVNCAFGVGAWEKFHKRVQPDGSVAYESAAFPGVYLRMDAQSIDTFGVRSGSGIVNCQFGVGAWEKFAEHEPPFTSITWPPPQGLSGEIISFGSAAGASGTESGPSPSPPVQVSGAAHKDGVGNARPAAE